MILHRASGKLAASARTRILASLINARRAVEALRVIGALRSAVRRTTDVILQAGARRMQAYYFALRVRATWIRHARVLLSLRQRRDSTDSGAVYEGIANVATGTAADRIVIHRKTVGVLSARARTRVRALVIDTRFVLRALGADDATWSTGRRNAGESWQAQTHRVTFVSSAIAVGSARRRHARIGRCGVRRHNF